MADVDGHAKSFNPGLLTVGLQHRVVAFVPTAESSEDVSAEDVLVEVEAGKIEFITP